MLFDDVVDDSFGKNTLLPERHACQQVEGDDEDNAGGGCGSLSWNLAFEEEVHVG